MRIADVRAFELKPYPRKLKYFDKMPAHAFERVLVRVIADNGLEGHCITYLMPPAAMRQRLAGVRQLLIGRDPHDTEFVSYALTAGLERPDHVASTIDICLWDLIGKHHKTPVYKLLGAARDRLRAYASTYSYETVEEYVQIALEAKSRGFTALKLHAHGMPDKDIIVCRAVREAVGDEMDLMIDPVNAYDRAGALKVGRVLEDLDFIWLEAPVPDSDIDGLADLSRRLSIPIAAVESVFTGFRSYAPYLTGRTVAALRSVGDAIGGITAMRKTAALCEAFHVKYEPHSYGTTLVQAAHLHLMLSIFHCDFVEIPVPLGMWDEGMKSGIEITPDGFVNAPQDPGLGYGIDEDAIRDMIVNEM